MRKFGSIAGLVLVFCLVSFSLSYGAPIKQIYFSKKTNLAYPKTYTLRFSLWDVESGGAEGVNMVWSEEKDVLLKKPKLATYLGDVQSFSDPLNPFGPVDFSSQYYVQVDRKTKAGQYRMVGKRRIQLGVVPYALWAEQTDSVAPLTSVTAGNGLTQNSTVGDVILNVGNGVGISVGADIVSIAPTYRLPQGCLPGEIPEWDGAAWICATDDIGAAGPLPAGQSAQTVFNGIVTTDGSGAAVITLPANDLSGDFRYQLTVIDEGDAAVFAQAKVTKKVSGNTFAIRTSAPDTQVSWQVTLIAQTP